MADPASATYSIFLVEDDDDLAAAMTSRLEGYGYAVVRARDYDDPAGELREADAHLVVLDVNLPRYDGFVVCRAIREVSAVPILFVSARDGSMDQVMGLSAGGDDYLTKPFSPDVLIARIAALLRRTYELAGTERDVLRHGGITLDLQRATVRANGEEAELSRNEFRILHALLSNAGEIVTRDELVEALWQRDAFVDENTLTVNVNRLRRRLAQLGLEDVIVTRKHKGYLIR